MRVTANLFLIALLCLCCLSGCGNKRHGSMPDEAVGDLQQIKDSGELVVLTLYFLLQLSWPGNGVPVRVE